MRLGYLPRDPILGNLVMPKAEENCSQKNMVQDKSCKEHIPIIILSHVIPSLALSAGSYAPDLPENEDITLNRNLAA